MRLTCKTLRKLRQQSGMGYVWLRCTKLTRTLHLSSVQTYENTQLRRDRYRRWLRNLYMTGSIERSPQETSSSKIWQFPVFYGTRAFITVFTTGLQLSIPWARRIQPTSSNPFLKINSNIILPSMPRSSEWSLLFKLRNQNCLRTSYLHSSRGSSVNIVSLDWTTGVRSPAQAKECPLVSVSRPALGSTLPPVQWVPGVLFPGIKHGRGVTLTSHPI
jgi:hypothetical protein